MATYREAYPQTLTDGIGLVSQLIAMGSAVWGTHSESFKKSLELAYAMRSGFKTVLDTFMEIPEEDRTKVIFQYYIEKWKKLYNIYQLEYNPLSAYRVVESGKNTRTPNLTDTNNYGRTQTDITKDSGSVIDVSLDVEKSLDGVFGFNSEEAVSSDVSDGHTTTNTNQTRDLVTNKQRSDGGADSIIHTGTEITDHEVSKEGNIGYSTPQKLLREEFDLWKTPFYEKMFADIDAFITIQVF